MTALTEHYQQTDIRYVFNVIRAGESCSLIGIGSVGKSSLLRFLMHEQVRREYLHAEDSSYIMVLLDPHQMVHLESEALAIAGSYWSGYEMLLNRLHRALWELQVSERLLIPREDAPSALEKVYACYQQLLSSDALLTQSGLRHFEAAVYQLLRLNPEWRLIFLFDDIEEFIRRLPAEFFQSLRGVRDEFKQRLLYITTSRHPLNQVVTQYPEQAATLEGFTELFNQFTHYISPLDLNGTTIVVQGFIKRYNLELAPDEQESVIHALYRITGGHVGLLRQSVLSVADIRDSLDDAATGDHPGEYVLDYLLRVPSILKECQIIFDSLTQAEITTLHKIVNQQPIVDEQAFKLLSDKHLIGATGSGMPDIRIPILQRYMFRKLPPDNSRA